MHVDDHNGGMWMLEADWLAWIAATPPDQELLPLLGVQFDDVYVSVEEARAAARGRS